MEGRADNQGDSFVSIVYFFACMKSTWQMFGSVGMPRSSVFPNEASSFRSGDGEHPKAFEGLRSLPGDR